MKIQVGEVYMNKITDKPEPYPNKTLKYLVPCLKEYGQDFKLKFNNVCKIAVGIGDIVTTDCGIVHEKHLFLLLNPRIASSYFLTFMEWIKEQPMYEDDYAYGNLQRDTYHMIVLRLPEKFYEAFETFKIGGYSKMFDQETIDLLFGDKDVKSVLIRDHNYKITFTDRINRRFNTELKPDDWSGELDFPPTDKTDVFNHHLKK